MQCMIPKSLIHVQFSFVLIVILPESCKAGWRTLVSASSGTYPGLTESRSCRAADNFVSSGPDQSHYHPGSAVMALRDLTPVLQHDGCVSVMPPDRCHRNKCFPFSFCFCKCCKCYLTSHTFSCKHSQNSLTFSCKQI